MKLGPEPASAHPKARVFFVRAPGILPVRRSRLALLGRILAVVTNQFFFKNLPVLTFDLRGQGFRTPLARRRSSYPPSSPNLVLTHPTVSTATRLRVLRHPIRLSVTISPASRVPHAPEGHHIGVRERCTWRNRPDITKLPTLVNQPAGSGGQPVSVTFRG